MGTKEQFFSIHPKSAGHQESYISSPSVMKVMHLFYELSRVAEYLVHRIIRYEGQKVFCPSFDTRIAPLLRSSRNSTPIRNPLIFQGKSQGHQSKIGDSPHVCAGQQVRALILEAGTSSDLLTLVS